MKPEFWKEISIGDSYAEVELFGSEGEDKTQKALFYDGRLKRGEGNIPAGGYIYSIRHDDESMGDPVEICYDVMVNFFGTIVTYKPIELNENRFKMLDSWKDFEYTDTSVKPEDVESWIREQKKLVAIHN